MAFTLADLHQSPGAERPGITRTRWGSGILWLEVGSPKFFCCTSNIDTNWLCSNTCSHFAQVLLNGENTGCTWVQGMVHGQFNGWETLPVTLSQSLNQNLFTHHSLLFTNKSSPVPLWSHWISELCAVMALHVRSGCAERHGPLWRSSLRVLAWFSSGWDLCGASKDGRRGSEGDFFFSFVQDAHPNGFPLMESLRSPYGVPFLHLCALLLQIHGPA